MSMTTQAPSLQNAGPGAFVRFTDAVSRITGSSGATLRAAAALLVWLLSGPFFHFSDTWQLVVNTGTTVLTFLMVFVIQATQIRDSTALHGKLDTLIAGPRGAASSTSSSRWRAARATARSGSNAPRRPRSTGCAASSSSRSHGRVTPISSVPTAFSAPHVGYLAGHEQTRATRYGDRAEGRDRGHERGRGRALDGVLRLRDGSGGGRRPAAGRGRDGPGPRGPSPREGSRPERGGSRHGRHHEEHRHDRPRRDTSRGRGSDGRAPRQAPARRQGRCARWRGGTRRRRGHRSLSAQRRRGGGRDLPFARDRRGARRPGACDRYPGAGRAGRPNGRVKENSMELLAALSGGVATLLWIIAAVLVIAGIVWIIRGGVLAGIVLIIIGCLVGPGGVSIFH